MFARKCTIQLATAISIANDDMPTLHMRGGIMTAKATNRFAKLDICLIMTVDGYYNVTPL